MSGYSRYATCDSQNIKDKMNILSTMEQSFPLLIDENIDYDYFNLIDPTVHDLKYDREKGETLLTSITKTPQILPLNIIKIPCDDRMFNLIQDSYLPAGTKQRGLPYFIKLKELGYTEIVTYGTVYGYGQVATAWCCKEVGLLCTIFLPETFPRTKMTKEAIKYGALIVDVGPDGRYPTTPVVSLKAHNYISKNAGCKLLELGLDDPEYIQTLADEIKAVKGNIDPKRIWIAGGSGVLARAISKAFPNAQLCIVQVGRKIYPDILEGMKHNLYISPEPFKQNAQITPPYKSLRHYDAKVWRFVQKYGNDGDYIWNVK